MSFVNLGRMSADFIFPLFSRLPQIISAAIKTGSNISWRNKSTSLEEDVSRGSSK